MMSYLDELFATIENTRQEKIDLIVFHGTQMENAKKDLVQIDNILEKLKP
jgi:hypothetical protein